MQKGSRAERYRRAKARKTSPAKKKPPLDLEMTQVQKVIVVVCVGLGIIVSWVAESILGFSGIFASMIFSGIGGGLGSVVGMGIVLLMLTPDQKRKHMKKN